MDIDHSAPITSRGSIEIAATPLQVWAIIADIDRWPSWNTGVDKASLEGPLQPGTTFRWKAGPGRITSVLRSVETSRELGWTGKTMGIDAVHVWRLEPTQSGARLSTDESWRGWPVRLMRKRMQRALDEAIAVGLGDLKAEAERRARATDRAA